MQCTCKMLFSQLVVLTATVIASFGCCYNRCGVVPHSPGGCADEGCSDYGGDVAIHDDECDGGCGPCLGDHFPGACGQCSSGHCGGLSGLMLPLLSSRLACGAGCGPVYWNEWICDPPVCCDPCNDCGCWVGPRLCPPGHLIRSTWFGVTGAVRGLVRLGLCGHCGLVCGGSCGGVSHEGCDDPGCAECGAVPHEEIESYGPTIEIESEPHIIHESAARTTDFDDELEVGQLVDAEEIEWDEAEDEELIDAGDVQSAATPTDGKRVTRRTPQKRHRLLSKRLR